ncbi:single-stranded-DNA-specific exonuclease RecJ [Trichocoleus sp. FACHB-262]|nr:single-stranded-DNA-specific exonuclease RecJ [Trichocoleus sp. FACHB-262]
MLEQQAQPMQISSVGASQAMAETPAWFVQAVQQQAVGLPGHYAAQLLWQRGIRDPEQLAGFLHPQFYQPTSPFEFGQEMQWAVERLQQARNQDEVVAIWGDFDADGITATAVLWDGLGQFFSQGDRLIYYIPNRLIESHGLSYSGLDRLAAQGCQLVVTCDTGSTNLAEIRYAQSLGMDVVITDHHTLPSERPTVTALINPRYLLPTHPLAHLSGVAVAYKLVEALYQTWPEVPQQPLTHLLDLVAIGLIADLVQLTGDCRYLAQQGIEQLQQHLINHEAGVEPARPGIARLLELCKKSGDRPTDISFGLGPRINAVSRIQGDAHFCVELLTSRDEQRCQQLAEETELANMRRKALQREVTYQVKDRLSQLDLSTTSVIVLVDTQWPVGILGLVAGQIAQEYGRPTILLNADSPDLDLVTPSSITEGQSQASALARGSARSVNQIDLYQLVQDQAHLLHSFGGHPFAAGLSLPVANLPLFTEAVNRQLRQQNCGITSPASANQADLVVTVAELGKTLFRELKLLEPCGMGNPVPKLMMRNCWFERAWHRNSQDWQGRKVQYIKTEFVLRDDSSSIGFPGVWWGHYKEELSSGRCDVVVELDFNTYENRRRGQAPHYEVRLLEVLPASNAVLLSEIPQPADWLVDWREDLKSTTPDTDVLLMTQCPTSWAELQVWFRRAVQEGQRLAIAYPSPSLVAPTQIWQQLIGIAKYLGRTGDSATLSQFHEKLGIGDRPLQLGFQALHLLGFAITHADRGFRVEYQAKVDLTSVEMQLTEVVQQFLGVVQEEQFRRQYFYQVPLSTLQAVAHQTILLQTHRSPQLQLTE